MVAEIPDPGVSVQIQQHAKGLVRLYFMHQAVTEEGEGWLEPAGGVVCELTFQMRVRLRRPVELWTFDYPDFGRFVDGVEQHRAFTDLTVRQPVQTAVYWEEA